MGCYVMEVLINLEGKIKMCQDENEPYSRMWSLFPRQNVVVLAGFWGLKEVLIESLHPSWTISLHPQRLFDLSCLGSVLKTLSIIFCKHHIDFSCTHRTQPSVKYYYSQKDDFSIFHSFSMQTTSSGLYPTLQQKSP